ncbi:hypothetical protein D3C75_1381890 [compost metagenome]
MSIGLHTDCGKDFFNSDGLYTCCSFNMTMYLALVDFDVLYSGFSQNRHAMLFKLLLHIFGNFNVFTG